MDKTFFKPGKYQRIAIILILSSTVFLSVLDIFIVNVALPTIRKGIQASEGDLQLVIAAYLIGYASFMIFGGKLGDRLGQRKMLLIGTVGFGVSSLFCGLAGSALQLDIARGIQGIFAAIMVPQGLAIIQRLFSSKKERAWALGIYGTTAGIASVLGQFLGGFLPGLAADSYGWRLIFLINLPLTLIVVAGTILLVPKIPPLERKKFDYLGVGLLSLFLLCLIVPLIRGRELGWPLWSLLMLALVWPLWKMFERRQELALKRGRDKLIELALFSHLHFRIGTILTLFYFIAQDSYFLINGIFLQDGLGISALRVGILYVFQGIGYVIGSMVSTRLSGYHAKKVIFYGLWVMISTLFGHLFAFDSAQMCWSQYLLLAFYGLGCGSVLPTLLSISLSDIPPIDAGSAAGLYSTVQQTAIALGVALVGGVFFYFEEASGSKMVYLEGYRWATILNMVFLVIVLITLRKLPAACRASAP